MDRLQARLVTLEQDLSDPELYSEQGRERLKTMLAEQGRAKGRLSEVEAQWLEISEAVENLELELATQD